MKKEDERFWLDLNRIKRDLTRARYHYTGTKDYDDLSEMIEKIKILMNKLEKNE